MYTATCDTSLRPSTILVEIFVNEKIDDSDTATQNKLIGCVTQAIDTCIIKKQEDNGKSIRYYVYCVCVCVCVCM